MFKKILPFCLCLSVFAACEKSPVKSIASQEGRVPDSTIDPKPEQGEVWNAEKDNQAEEVLIDTKQLLLERSKNDSFLYRDAHPKHHGCVKAFFQVDARQLPADLRVGIFATTAPIPAWVRYSNGNPDGVHSPDLNKDIRGMAVKLINIPGTPNGSQDFVMITSKEFFSRNADDYVDFHHALVGNKLALPWYLVTHPSQAKILLAAQIQTGSPLNVEYFSSVPYKLGSHSMKFKARPCESNEKDPIPKSAVADNYLRERLVSSLKEKSACYEFLVQPNQDPEKNLVENHIHAWDETKSPYIHVATITIPVQDKIDSQEHINFCENINFDPWHSLPETRPLGQINRMRRRIYPAISTLRHEYNHIPESEPKSHEICSGETALLCQTPKH